MKTFRTALLATILSAGASLAFTASAHGHDHGHDHGRGHDRGHDDGYRGDERHHDHGRHRGRPHYVRHYGRWERGHAYRGPVVVVRDYDRYELRRPPRGYHWVRDDGTYLLVAIGTGIILDIALH